MLLAEHTWEEVGAALKKCDIAIIPTGSTEQHGHHLPLNSDAFNAFELSKKVAETVKNEMDVVITPPLVFGVSLTHMGFPGSITLSPPTYMNVLKDICRSLIAHDVKKIVVINGHGGNTPSINAAFQELIMETDTQFFLVNWWDMSSDVIRENFNFLFHADQTETSVALALGQKVYLDKIKGDMPPTPSKYVEYSLVPKPPKVAMAIPPFHKMTKIGSIGDPTKTDKRKGEAIVKAIVERTADFLRDLKKQA